jgi:hypothetical protein
MAEVADGPTKVARLSYPLRGRWTTCPFGLFRTIGEVSFARLASSSEGTFCGSGAVAPSLSAALRPKSKGGVRKTCYFHDLEFQGLELARISSARHPSQTVTLELHNHPYANRGRRAALRHPRRSHSSTAVREPVAPATHATSEAPDPSALARVRWRHSGGDSGSARLIGLPRCQSRHRRGGLLSGDHCPTTMRSWRKWRFQSRTSTCRFSVGRLRLFSQDARTSLARPTTRRRTRKLSFGVEQGKSKHGTARLVRRRPQLAPMSVDDRPTYR